MKDRAVRLREVAVAGDTLQLAPGLAAGMPIGADVAAAEPAMVGTIRLGTEVRVGVDSAPAASGEGDEGRWRARRLGAYIGSLLTGLTQRFVDQSGERVWVLWSVGVGAYWVRGAFGARGGLSGNPTWMRRQINTRATSEELVKQQVGCHDESPLSR